MSILAERAMLASVRIAHWSGRKLDKRVTAETNARHNAAADAGRYNKALLSKEAIADVLRVENSARAEHYARTLPWRDDGARILSAAGYLDYADKMRGLRAEFDSAVESFVAGYPDFVEAARARLNGMFDPADYPGPDDIRGRFRFSVDISPVPDAADFRVAIGDAQAAAVRADLERRSDEALQAAMRDAWQRVADATGRMVERLRAYQPGADGKKAEGVFRDSLVENVRELAGLLPTLNIAGSPDLARMAERLQADLCEADADQLRESDNMREKTADAAAAILADVSAFLA